MSEGPGVVSSIGKIRPRARVREGRAGAGDARGVVVAGSDVVVRRGRALRAVTDDQVVVALDEKGARAGGAVVAVNAAGVGGAQKVDAVGGVEGARVVSDLAAVTEDLDAVASITLGEAATDGCLEGELKAVARIRL